MVEKKCPFRFEHCAAFSREEKYDSQQNANHPSNITKIFMKDCASDRECSTPSPRCSEHGSVAATCSHDCCHGYLCNTGKSAMGNAHGSLALLLAVVLAVIFLSPMDEEQSENCDLSSETGITLLLPLSLPVCFLVVSRPPKGNSGLSSYYLFHVYR